MIAEHEQPDAARTLLATIRDGHGLIELRALRRGRRGAVCEWYEDPTEAVAHARGACRGIDLYVGAVARARRGSGRDALGAHGRHAWADCDTAEAVAALRVFRPLPTFVVESGGLDGVVPRLQAWWLTVDRLTLGAVERLNRRLALALGADPASVDAPRVLRMPGTVHSKTGRTAKLVYVGDEVRVCDLAVMLPALLEPSSSEPRSPAGGLAEPVSASEYVPRLSGHEVGRDGKALCPFHDERTPSLHAYDEPGQGWFCFGCRRGGDVFTFAGLLWGLDPRDDFPELRRRVLAELGVGA